MGTKSPQCAKKVIDISKLLKDGLRSIDKCDLLNKNKVWCICFGLFPKLSWPLQVYEVSFTKVETMEG